MCPEDQCTSPLTALPVESGQFDSDEGYVCPDSELDRVVECRRLKHLLDQMSAFDDWMFSGNQSHKQTYAEGFGPPLDADAGSSYPEDLFGPRDIYIPQSRDNIEASPRSTLVPPLTVSPVS